MSRWLIGCIAILWVCVIGNQVEAKNDSPRPAGLQMARPDESPCSIPFLLDRNRVILAVSVNGSRELKIILDTGMPFDGVYLFHRELIEEVPLEDTREVRVGGAGSGEASTALQADSAVLSLAGIEFLVENVVIAQDETTQTFPTDGVIGWTLFGSYVVEIDYDRQLIMLHDPAGFVADSTWEAVPLSLKKNIPFLEAAVIVSGEDTIPIAVYIDLASGDALELLIAPDMTYELPGNLVPEYQGTGLSGDIYGQRGTTRRLFIGSYELCDIPTAFVPAEVRSRQEGADGILGNNVMRRFNLVFDYPRERLWMKPNSHYRRPFEQ